MVIHTCHCEGNSSLGGAGNKISYPLSFLMPEVTFSLDHEMGANSHPLSSSDESQPTAFPQRGRTQRNHSRILQVQINSPCAVEGLTGKQGPAGLIQHGSQGQLRNHGGNSCCPSCRVHSAPWVQAWLGLWFLAGNV